MVTSSVLAMTFAAPVSAQVQPTIQLPSAPHAVGETAGFFIDPETGNKVYRLTDPVVCGGSSGGRHEYSYTIHFSRKGRIVARCTASNGVQRFPIFDSSYTMVMTDALAATKAPAGVTELQWSQTDEKLYGRSGRDGKVYRLDPFAGTIELVADFRTVGAIGSPAEAVYGIQTMYIGAGDRIVAHLQNATYKVLGIGSFDPATGQYAVWALSDDPDGASFDEAAPTQNPAGGIHMMAPSKLFSFDFASRMLEGGMRGHYGFLTLSNSRSGVVKGWSDSSCAGGSYRYEFAIVDDETGQPIVKFGCELPQQIAWNHWGRSVGAPDVFSLSTDRWTYAPSNTYSSTHEAVIRGVVNYVGSVPSSVRLTTVAHHRSAVGPRSRVLGRDCGYWATPRAAIDHTGTRFMFDSTMSHPEWPAREVDGTLRTSCSNDVYVTEAPQPLIIATSTVPDGKAGVAYQTTISAQGGTEGQVWSVVDGALPAGLILTPDSGTISGTPIAEGPATFTVHVHDSDWNADSRTFTASIAPAIDISTTSVLPGVEYGAYSARFAATGGSGQYVWSIASGSLPANLTLDPASALISGVPSAAGTYAFAVKAQDTLQAAWSDTQAFNIVIVRAPVEVMTTQLPGGIAGSAYTAALQARGGTRSFQWSVVAGVLPSGVNLNPVTGVLAGTPASGGPYSFTAQARDSEGGTDTQQLTLAISLPPVDPTRFVLAATADAYVRAGTYASSNFGSAPELVSKGSSTVNYQRESYLKFDLSSVSTIGSATLRLFGRLSDDRTTYVQTGVHTVGGTTWNESTLTWKNKPLATSPIGVLTVINTANGWYEVDITEFVRTEKSAGRNVIGLGLKSLTDSLPYTSFNSKEAADNHPELVVTPVITLAAAADAYVRAGSYASSNFGSAPELISKGTASASYQRESYLKFDLTNVGTVRSATLRLFGRLSDGRNTDVQTHVFSVATTGWSESTLRWTNKPAAGVSPIGVFTVANTAETWYELDLTAFVRAEKNAGRNSIAIVLKNLLESLTYTSFNSREAAGNQPEMVVR